MDYVIIGLLVVVILINIVLVIKVSKKNETSSLTLKDLKDNNEIKIIKGDFENGLCNYWFTCCSYTN